MQEFLNFVDEKRHGLPMHVEIYYSNDMDWCINVYVERYFEDGRSLRIVDVQSCDIELAFAKAQVQLKEWLLENEGGY